LFDYAARYKTGMPQFTGALISTAPRGWVRSAGTLREEGW
jgi:hypothetical protein